jgi:hypothetical protein
MKRSIKILTAALLVAMAFSVANAAGPNEKEKKIDWKSYGENLAWALRSDNIGLQRSALLTIIHKGENIELGKGIYDLMNVYLTHEDERFRQLALIAIHKTQNDWAMNYLKARYHAEKSKKLKKLMAIILHDYFKPHA